MSIMIIKLQKMKRKEKLAQALITDYISFTQTIHRYEEKVNDEENDYKQAGKFKSDSLAFDILEIYDEDLRGELLDLIHDHIPKDYSGDPEKIMLKFWEEMIPYVDKEMRAAKIYNE